MPDQQVPNPTASPFEIVTPGKSKKGGKTGIVIAILVVVFLILSVVAGVLLVRQQQQIAEKAAGGAPAFCPDAEACPYSKDPTLLRNCHPPQSDGTPKDSICNQAGRVQTCGAAATQFCCPSAGAAWTTNMTVCNALASPSPSPSPTPTLTPTPTETPTGTPTETPTESPTPTATTVAQTTPLPIPVTGISWPTALGIGVGAAAIIISILIAL